MLKSLHLSPLHKVGIVLSAGCMLACQIEVLKTQKDPNENPNDNGNGNGNSDTSGGGGQGGAGQGGADGANTTGGPEFPPGEWEHATGDLEGLSLRCGVDT